MRNPKKKSGRKPPEAGPSVMAMDGAGSAGAAATGAGDTPTVWRPGVDPMAEDEELAYDPSAYDCLHKFSLEWPCLSFDFVKDELGGPRSTFPHTVFMVAGTQAANPRQNYLAVLKLADLGQGRHGKKPDKQGDESSDEEDGSSEEDESSSDEEMDEADEGAEGKPREGRLTARREGQEPPARMHHRLVGLSFGVNRLRSCWQQPGVIALWADNGSVRVMDVREQLAQLAGEAEVLSKAASKTQLTPLHSHSHSTEGFALDWSRVVAGRLVTGDCKKHIHVWEPQEGGRWTVSPAYSGHSGSVEDLQWSPSEATVFASCSTDKSIAVFDTRDRSKAQLQVVASDTDVNVISWNRLVGYMMASGDDSGLLRVWDLRAFKEGGFVSQFNFHKSSVTSVEWSPYESSMLATSGADDQVCCWDLALERDPEEEEALAPEGNALLQEDVPSQLLFVHAGQSHIKELHWHAQIPGLIGSTAADGFNLFRPSNL